MWGNILIGGLSDQTNFIIWSFLSNFPFRITLDSLGNYPVYRDILHSQLYPWLSNEPLFMTFMSFFLSLFGPNFYNVFLLITLLLNLYFSYDLFKRFKYSWFYVLIFNFSSYFWLHLGEHLELNQLWLYCLLVKYILDGYWKIKPYRFGLFLVIAGLISNYIGFFSSLYFVFYYIFYSIVYRKTEAIKTTLVPVLKLLSVFMLSIFFVLFPYIRNNVFVPSMSVHEITSKHAVRTIEEYVSFSSRPWYFLLPSTANPVFGPFSQLCYFWISSTGHYLTDDYFARESPSNYFGLSFLALFCICLTIYYRNISEDVKKSTIILFLTAISIFIFMMPPVITLWGIDFYNISFLLYKLIPVFRVTLRFGVLLQLTFLVILGYVLGNKSVKYQKQFFIVVLIVTLLETYVPVKFTKLEVPEVYYFINSSFTSPSSIVIYPYSRTKEALFYTYIHKQYLVNPRGYNKGDFASEAFTSYLVKDPERFYFLAKNMNLKYIISFDESISDLMTPTRFRLIRSFSDGGDLYEMVY